MTEQHFQYILSTPQSSLNGYITLGGEKVHRIHNRDDFFKSLGYTDEKNKAGLLPEEFIWSEYRKDNCKKSKVCLQIRIIQYLNKHSVMVKEKYPTLFENSRTKCFEKWCSNSAECIDCSEPQLQN
jgi:hypothetical protein